MIIGVQHTCIHVYDLEKSLEFYRDVLGLRERYRMDQEPSPRLDRVIGVKGASLKVVHLEAGKGDEIELIQYMTPKGKHIEANQQDVGNLHIAFYVDDIVKTYNDLVKKGVKFVTPPNELISEGPETGWRMCYFHDPDGVLLELVEQRYWWTVKQSEKQK